MSQREAHDELSTLGPTLTLIRLVKRLSQGAVARQAGIGKSQLSKYESGKELPKLDSLSKVLRVLDLRLAEFTHLMDLVSAAVGRNHEALAVLLARGVGLQLRGDEHLRDELMVRTIRCMLNLQRRMEAASSLQSSVGALSLDSANELTPCHE